MCLAVLSASAQDTANSPVALDPYDVTSHPAGADERTASIWVVTPDENVPPSSRLSDTLLEIPGLHIQQSGGAGGRETIYMRGSEENHTLVFLNGVPLNDPNDSRGGGVDLSSIEPANVTRAAVVRGPASVRFGPDALAGVMHIESGSPTEQGARLVGEYGGDGFRRYLASGSTPLGENASIEGGASYFEDGQADLGTIERTFLHGAFHYSGPLNTTISAWHGRNQATVFPDDSGGFEYAEIRTLESRDEERTGLAMRLQGEWGLGEWTATADYAQLDSFVDSPGVAPGPRDPAGLPATLTDTRLKRFRALVMTEKKSTESAIAVGFDFQHEDGTSDSVLDFGFFEVPANFELTRSRVGAFAEASGTIVEGVTLAGGARVDHYDDDLTRVTARAGILGTVGGSESTQWRINAGNSFKAPSFFALAHPLVGNPDIKPETAVTIEAGLRHVLGEGRGLVDFTVFATRIRDAIDFDPGPPPIVANVDGIDSHGVELALAYHATEQITIRGAGTWLSAKSDPGNERMRGRPDWQGSLAVTYKPVMSVSLNAQVTAVGTVRDSSIATDDVILDSWTRFDLSAVWAARDSIELIGAVDNLFDEDYQEAVGFPSQRVRLRAGVRLIF